MKGSDLSLAFHHVVAASPGIARAYRGRLERDWEQHGLPAALSKRMAGAPSSDTDRDPRFRVDVWAVGESAAEVAMESVRETLVGDEFSSCASWHATPYGVIDHVEADSELIDVGYQHATIVQLSMSFRVHTRTF